MTDHPSWPAELVEKGAKAILRAQGVEPDALWADYEEPTREAYRRFAEAVLSALSGDLVPREEHERARWQDESQRPKEATMEAVGYLTTQYEDRVSEAVRKHTVMLMAMWRSEGRSDERIEHLVKSLVLNAYVAGQEAATPGDECEEALRALCDLDERLTISGNPADVEDWQTAIATVKDWLA